jgi:hypothetical protein
MRTQSISRSRKVRVHAVRLCCEHSHVSGHYGPASKAGQTPAEKVAAALRQAERMSRWHYTDRFDRLNTLRIPYYRAWLAGYDQAVAA